MKVRQAVPARPLQGLPAMTLLEVTIKPVAPTRFRFTLASQGHPIVGDGNGDF